MKKQLLKMYSAFISISMFCFTDINGQIIYTDVIPDSLVTSSGSQSYTLDLNSDGTFDYTIGAAPLSGDPCFDPNHFSGGAYVIMALYQSNAVAYSTLSPFEEASKFNSGKIINASVAFVDTVPVTLIQRTYDCTSFHNFGIWNGAIDKYLGLKLVNGNLIYYGWARLDVHVTVGAGYSAKTSNFTIKDYAYNSIPNQPILTGEISCSTPTVNLTASGSLSFCNGDSVTLTANGTGYKYQWKKGGVNIAGANKQTYVAKTAGTYKCKVTNSCGSITSAGKTVTVPCRLTNEVFTEHLDSPYELRIAPNPLSNSTNIFFSLDQAEKVSLKIFDLNGRLIKSLADNVFNEGENSVMWNVENVNAGIYFLQVQTAEYSKTEKLIVTK